MPHALLRTTTPAAREGVAALRADLVSAHRTGRVVLYARTHVGESLVGG